MSSKRLIRPYLQTPDGRYFIVNSRLWRLSNPKLTAEVRAHWVHELMQARRQVRVAKADSRLRAMGRIRVDAAKRALGERGPPWWDDGAPDYNRHNVANTPYASWFASRVGSTIAEAREFVCFDLLIEARIIASLTHRESGASTCPSEIARSLAPNKEKHWRSMMPQVREVAAKLARAGRVRITRGSVALDPNKLVGGPVRIRPGPKFKEENRSAVGTKMSVS